MSAWPHGDPRDVVHRITSDARFRLAPQRPGEKTWTDYAADALRNVWHWLSGPLDTLTGNSFLSTVVAGLVLLTVAVLLCTVVAWFASGVSRRPRAANTRRSPTVAYSDADAATLLARALEAASEGRHREAAALLWASALRALDERGRVRYDAARSPGEWRRAVRDPSFDALARDAVVALFGDRDADAALVARMRAAYDRVVAPA